MSAPRREPSAARPAATSPALLAVEDLSITHEGADAATPASVTFDVRPGEVVLILGPSGSGKSTLALALNGLIPQAVPATVDGRVLVAGLDTAVETVATLSTRVGMVFQDPDAQLVTGTVLDEVAFGPENLRMPVADILERAEAALRRVGLWDRRGENPDRLSGGGRQRLAIACALAMGSPLLVLDEPTANLDPQGIDEVYAALADVVSAGDRAILLVEHNLDAAVGLVDRVVVLDHEGRLFADGPTDIVLRHRAGELHELGVWLPTSTLAALRLRRAGYRLDPLPLTPAELRAALEPEDPPVSEAASRQARSASPAGGGRRERRPASQPPLITVRGLTLDRGRTRVLHGIDLDVGAGRIHRDRRCERRRQDDAHPGDRRDRAAAPRQRADRRPFDRLRTPPGCQPRGCTHAVFTHRLRLPEPRASIHRAHRVRRTRAWPASAPSADSEVRERTEQMLDRFGLSAKGQTHPFLLSGGQKRRLSVGTALVAGAPVLALDEPTFGQDRARADELLRLLRELNSEGTTILVVTHDMQLVTEHADRTIVLAGGSVLAQGATSDVFADPALIEAAGLRLPPLRRALEGLSRHPALASVVRLADLPGSPGGLND